MVLVLMTILASCANNTSTPSDTTTATDNAVATDAVTTEPVVDYYKNIPDDLRFDNYTFKILTYDGNTWNTYLDCDQILGSTLNDAAFTRNLEVCEKFGISIEVTKLPHAQIIKEIQVMNQAGGSDSYDLVCFWATTNLASLLTTNDLYDWQDIEYVGLEEDWFNQTANKAFNIVGRQLFAVSDLTYPIQQNFRVLCNLNAVANAGLEPPYSHVYNGTWTYETFYEYIANRYVDNNNDGKQDEGDTYGLDSNINPVSRFINNWGESPITIGENSFVLNLYSERLTDMLTKMNKLLYDGDCYQGGSSNNYKVFFSGRAMFNIFSSDPALLINIDSFKFGNLPYPKYDESQEDFITVTHGGLMAVPSGNSNPDRAGAIIEALSAASNKYLRMHSLRAISGTHSSG